METTPGPKNILGLQLPTDPRWVDLASISLEDILTDHAWCEQKAATSCISLIQRYPSKTKLVTDLAPIVTEEWGHFRLVLAELAECAWPAWHRAFPHDWRPAWCVATVRAWCFGEATIAQVLEAKEGAWEACRAAVRDRRHRGSIRSCARPTTRRTSARTSGRTTPALSSRGRLGRRRGTSSCSASPGPSRRCGPVPSGGTDIPMTPGQEREAEHG